MKTDFIEKPIIIKDIPNDSPFDSILLENNEKQIEEVCEFLQDDNKKLMLVNGFRGTGKSSVINFVSTNLNRETLILRYNCFETTILDDMLLSFFDTFRNYTIQGKIVPPRIKTENFTQKINSYFNSITRPILIVIDSYDAILRNNRNEVLSFVKHLMMLSNIKVLLIGRSFQFDDFQDLEYSRATILAFSQPLFEKYLRANGIKQIGVLSTELYKHSKGYFNHINLAVKIMNLRGVSLVQFLEKYSKSFMSFPEFIYRETLSLVDPVSAHLFRLLTVMRMPIHVNLLNSLHLFNNERSYFFVSNSVLAVEGECLYLKDYFREIIDNQIPENVMVKLHCACIDLYNTQLPLKPLERDLKLSRQTMRNEIEYHSMFLPKKPVILPKNTQVIDVNPVVEVKTEDANSKQVKPENIKPEIEETKEEKLNKINFIIEDEAVLDNIADSIKGFVTDTVVTSQMEEESNDMTLTQILNSAKQEEQKYNYKYVVILYQNALNKKDDDNFYKFLPTIYIKLAKAYKHLSNWYEALEYYTQAQDFYYNASNFDKVCEIKLEIANIYYIIYKYDNARYILNELENNQDLPNELKIRVNMTLAKLSENPKKEFEYYEKSLPLVDMETNKSVVAELYYKYAGACDEEDKTKTAVEYYKKCIELDSNPHTSKFLSRALANLAELYDEAGSSKFAIKYYNESMKIDLMKKDYNGLYFSAGHLAEIYSSFDTEKALNYMTQALEYAKELKEAFYIANASLELGDYFFVRKNIEQAYKYFIEAYKIAQKSFTKENLNKIESRLEDIKRQVSEEQYQTLQDKYGK